VNQTIRRLGIVTAAVFASLVLAAPAYADPAPPTNGGSNNGNGSSGQCTGPEAERPPSCHNGNGTDGN
jgi:hypothetical protein